MNLSNSLESKFNAIFPVWTTIVATIVALLIISIVLTKLVYQPIKKMNNTRKNYIQNNIFEAEEQNKVAGIDRKKANNELVNAHLEATKIISSAKIFAEEIKVNKLSQVKKQTQILLNIAKKDIKAQKYKFEQESKEAIIEVALAAAKKVVEKEVNTKINKKIIENFIKDNK